MALLADISIVITTAVLLGLVFVYLIPWALKKSRGPATITLIKPTEASKPDTSKSEGDVHESRHP